MEKIDRELLIKEISARLPYGVKAKVYGWDEEKGEVEIPLRIYSINTDGYAYFETNDYNVDYLNVDNCLLYLRPLSSMTKEEKKELLCILVGKKAVKHFQVLSDGSIESTDAKEQNLQNFSFQWINFNVFNTTSYINWLNAHHFDYRNLIKLGLALPAPEGMYKF